jgi:lysophospholipase L1-like esterase
MKRVRYSAILILLLSALVQIHPASLQSQSPAARPRRIAVFGSSVANGTGDEFGKEGYTGLLRQLLQPRGWEVLNQSRGGDTTKTMAPRFAPEGAPDPKTRYLLPVQPGYVVIALSLANEGLFEAKTKEEKDAVFKQYADGIQWFINQSRRNNIIPVVGLVYPRMVYTPVDYEYVRRMNILQNSWDVPSVNLLGAADDGTGRYTAGFDFDDKHPNAAGHLEFLHAFVPSLFDALEKGKPTPTRSASKSFVRVSDGDSPFTFTPQDSVHAFAISFLVRTQSDGTVAMIAGSTLAAKTETKTLGQRSFESTTLTTEKPFLTSIGTRQGTWTYTAANGSAVPSSVRADAQWHHVVLSHYTARGETLFYVDGKLAGKVAERLEPNRFVLGGAGKNGGAPRQADFKDLFVFRSALNADEVRALFEGKMLQASLEVYAPLSDARFKPDTAVENRAQSLSALKVGPGRLTHSEETSKQ